MNDHSNQYRINKLRNNYMKSDDSLQKLSQHSSSLKSPIRNSRKKSVNRYDRDKISSRSKVSYPSLNSSCKKTNQRVLHPKTIIEFNDVKWLSIISAYDPKKLQYVTASYESYQKFLKKNDIRNDQFGRSQYKALIQNFRKWAQRISRGYIRILNTFLYPPLNVPAIKIFSKVKPRLQEIKEQSGQMHLKVKGCIEVQDYRQFRGLLKKFDTFLEASKGIEEIIYIVNRSKHNIDNLFKEIEKDKHLDIKLQKQRKKGLKQVRKAVRDYRDDQAETKILLKVEAAINEMADKSLEAYGKIKGAKELMQRIKLVMIENRDFSDLNNIIIINKIFQQVLNEAREFQKFAEKFLNETDSDLNDDLRNCIQKYLQQLEIKKKTVLEMELNFITNIIEATIQILLANYSVCNVIQSDCFEEYDKIVHLLKDICDCLCDESKRTVVESMLHDTKNMFRKLKEIVIKLGKVPNTIEIDTSEGLEQLEELRKLCGNYKDTVRKVIEREEKSYYSMSKHRVKRQHIPQEDIQEKYIQKLVKISQKFNSKDKVEQLQQCPAYKPIKPNLTLQQLGKQLAEIKILKWSAKGYEKYHELTTNNQMGTILTKISLSNPIYQVSSQMIALHDLINNRQSTYLIELMNVSGKYEKIKGNEWLKYFYERVIAFIIVRGMDGKILKLVEDVSRVEFPAMQEDIQSLRSSIRYLGNVSKNIGGTIAREKIEAGREAMQQMIEGAGISEELKWNHKGEYYLPNSSICQWVDQLFTQTYHHKQTPKVSSLIGRLQTCNNNLSKLLSSQHQPNIHPLRLRKLSQLIQKYKEINHHLIQNLQQLSTDYLTAYAQVIFHLCSYLHQTNQSFYTIVNNTHHAMYLCMHEQVKEGISAMGGKFQADTMKRGEMVKQYNKNSMMMVSKHDPPKAPKQKTKKADEMVDEIGLDEMGEEMDEEMDEEMGEEIMEDNVDEMEEQMEEQMYEDMDDQVEDIQYQQNQLIDQLDQLSPKQKVKQRQQSTKSHPKQKQEQKTQTQKPQIIIKQKHIIQLYEKLPIEHCQQLQDLLQQLFSLHQAYWSLFNYAHLQEYFNKENSTISKQGQQLLEKMCKERFKASMIQVVKASNYYLEIKHSIQQILNKDMKHLSSVLSSMGRRYAKFLDHQNNLLYITIEHSSPWTSRSCVQTYIKHFIEGSSELTKLGEFNSRSFIAQLHKQKHNNQTVYTATKQSILPQLSLLQNIIRQLQDCMSEYKWNNQELYVRGDGVNVEELLLTLWQNAIDGGKVQINVCGKIDTDAALSKQVFTEEYMLYHFDSYRQKVKHFHTALQQHKRQLGAIMGEKNNILRSIEQIINIYQCQHVCKYKDNVVYARQESSKQQHTQLQQHIITILCKDTITWQHIQNTLPLMLPKYKTPIFKLLSILKVQVHYECTKQLLTATQAEILQHLLKHSTNNNIQTIQQLTESGVKKLQQQMATLVHSPFAHIHEYNIEKSKLLCEGVNRRYYEEIDEMVKVYQQRFKRQEAMEGNLSKCIMGNCLDLEADFTQLPMEYMEELEVLVESEIFNIETSIYCYHPPTHQKLTNLQTRMKEELDLLVSIVNQMEIVSADNINQLPSYLQHKYQLLNQWLLMYRKLSPTSITTITLAQSQQSKEQQEKIVYVGVGDVLDDVLGLFSDDVGALKEMIGEGDRVKNKVKFYWEDYVDTVLMADYESSFQTLLLLFNKYHFWREGKSKLQQHHKQMINTIEGRNTILTQLLKISDKLGSDHIVFQFIQGLFGVSNLNQELPTKNHQLSILKALHPESPYSQLMQLYKSYAHTVYGNDYITLLNRNDDEVVCFLPYDSSDKIQKYLKEMKLPTQWEQLGGMKIKLKNQNYTLEVETGLEDEELREFKEHQFGLEDNFTLAVSVSEKEVVKAVLDLADYQKKYYFYVNIDTSHISHQLTFSLVSADKYHLNPQEFCPANIFTSHTLTNCSLAEKIHLKQLKPTIIQQFKTIKNQKLEEEDQKRKYEALQKQQIQRFIDQLYESLSQSALDLVKKQQLDEVAEKQSKKELKSEQSIKVRMATNKVLQELQEKYSQNEQKQYKKITTKYIQALQNLLIVREQLFEDTIDYALHRWKNNQTINNHTETNSQLQKQFLSQVHSHKNFKEGLEQYALQQVRKMDEKEQNIIFMVYKFEQ